MFFKKKETMTVYSQSPAKKDKESIENKEKHLYSFQKFIDRFCPCCKNDSLHCAWENLRLLWDCEEPLETKTYLTTCNKLEPKDDSVKDYLITRRAK